MIVWKYGELTSRIASNRYRGMAFASELEKIGVRSAHYGGKFARINFLEEVSALVFVKIFFENDITLAKISHSLGIPVFVDLCDNIFIENSPSVIYDSDLLKNCRLRKQILDEMAPFLSAIITTTESLKRVIEINYPDINVYLIPDGIETEKLVDEVIDHLGRNQAGKSVFWYLWQEFPFRLTGFIQKVTDFTIFLVRWMYHHLFALVTLILRPSLPLKTRRVLKQIAKPYSILKKYKQLGVKQKKNTRDPQTHNLPEILWFGSKGYPGTSGISDLLLIQNELSQVYKKHPFCLHVMSNSVEDYQTLIAPLQVPVRYSDWSPLAFREAVIRAKAVVIPRASNSFAVCKSPNRALVTLLNGTPCIATPTEELLEFKDFILFENWVDNIVIALTRPPVAFPQPEIHTRLQTYSYQQLTQRWIEVLMKHIDKDLFHHQK